MENHVYKLDIGGREVVVESGKYCGQAGGSCIVRCGDTAVMVTATASSNKRDIDFFPLSVEYEEKMYAAGKIPGGFIKREGRPSEKAVLACRLIDRPIRPLFPKGYYNDVQVVATVLSVDTEYPPEIYAMIGSSVALSISGIPFAGPTGSVVVGMVDGEYVINPDSAQREKSELHLVVSGTKDAVMMVEAGANEVTEEAMLGAILYGHDEVRRICEWIQTIKDDIGKPPIEADIHVVPDEIDAAVREKFTERMVWAMDTFDRTERETREAQVKEEAAEYFAEIYPDDAKDVQAVLYNIMKETVRSKIINDGIRPDGRTVEEVRPIWCVMNFVTLGAMGDGQTLDGLSEDTFKRYIHHYNMPPYSTGEARPMRSASRREIGHGALAERAILPMLPDEEEFPYAIRAVSEVVSSNGSTSQASICASSLASTCAGFAVWTKRAT